MEKVLFIGNSHTFFEYLPWVFTTVCGQAGRDVHAGMSTYPVCDLRWHLESACTMGNLRHGGYDFIVIQQVAHPFEGADTLIEQGGALIKEILSAGAKPVIFCPWSEKRNPQGQEIINEAHDKLHGLFRGSLIAHYGAAWRRLRGVLDLYAEDGENQNHRIALSVGLNQFRPAQRYDDGGY
ncbi:MAG: hypothetical protein LBS19_10335 [Clostridiales bacterium]|jgi:hypothetical protein|nr:hypothetical protein [Clostridiales bacterium]